MRLIKTDTLLGSSVTSVIKSHNFSLNEALANGAIVRTAGLGNKSQVR